MKPKSKHMLYPFFPLYIEYCTIDRAAKAFNCEVIDLLVLAETRAIKLYIPLVGVRCSAVEVVSREYRKEYIDITDYSEEWLLEEGKRIARGLWSPEDYRYFTSPNRTFNASHFCSFSEKFYITTEEPISLDINNMFIICPDLKKIADSLNSGIPMPNYFNNEMIADEFKKRTTTLERKPRTEPKQTDMIKLLLQLIPTIDNDMSMSKKYDIISTLCVQKEIELPVEKRTFQRWWRDK